MSAVSPLRHAVPDSKSASTAYARWGRCRGILSTSTICSWRLRRRRPHTPFLRAALTRLHSIRISCVTALAEQYRRFATGRAVPQEMPIPRPRSVCRAEDIGLLPAPPPPPPPAPPDPVDFDRQTAIWSTNSDLPTFQSEPPSPPLTPKLSPDDEDDDNDTEPSDTNPRQSLRPKNSVFSIFCPEAMALQADPARPIPARGRCACGYKWNVASLSTETSSTTNTTTTTAASSSSASSSKSPYLAARDGFLITKRFLAKSHCDRGDDDTTAPKYACVLCTSTGRTEVYDTAEALRGHINKGHDKWQMLHDRDLCVTGLGGR